MPLTPVLAGQPSFYAITQLFLFREGRRSNEGMTAVAKTLTDNDLRGFADFIGTLPPVPAPAAGRRRPTPRACARRGHGAAAQVCVLPWRGFRGGQQVPRIAGQREDYLQMSLRGFHSGARPGYTQAMSAAVSQTSPEDLDTLAYYLARFPGRDAQRQVGADRLGGESREPCDQWCAITRSTRLAHAVTAKS